MSDGGNGFTPTVRHWWGDMGIKVLSAVVAAVSLVVAIFAYLKPPSASPAPVVNNYLPTIAGVPGQPVLESFNPCREAVDNIAGWGPERPVAVDTLALPWPTINADVANSDYGDERNFFRAKDAANSEAGGWSNEIFVEQGRQYILQFYVHNSGGATDPRFAAKNVRVRIALPSCSSRQISVSGIISGENTYPIRVWGGVTFKSKQAVSLSYVADTAVVYSNSAPNGKALGNSDFLTDAGSLVGTDALDGLVYGGYGSSFYVSVRVEAK